MLGVQPAGQGVISGVKKLPLIQVKLNYYNYLSLLSLTATFFSKSDSWYKITSFTIADSYVIYSICRTIVFQGPIHSFTLKLIHRKMFISR
jgi:hypothetical protein